MTRWETFYQDDPRTQYAPPSYSAMLAVDVFAAGGVHTILDVGCGAGRDTIFLAAHGFAVTGVDLAHSGLMIARRRGAHAIPLLLADARYVPLQSASFDAIYCFGLLHEFTPPDAGERSAAVISEIRRILRPGGILVLAMLAGDPDAGLPHVRLFTHAMVVETLKGFTLDECRLLDDVGCTGRANYRVWWARARQ